MSAKSSRSTATVSEDTASTYSFLSTTTTLKGKDNEVPKKKWFSLKSKIEGPKPKTARDTKKEALHKEAIASYIALR
ncbi:hypothetical protein BBP40_000494 [Aspergillus hancockii]|nr:hypothetical protein BBP40_000494 [Aspergillus hancockii]